MNDLFFDKPKNRLELLMQENNYTLKKVSENTGIPVTTLSGYKKNLRTPKKENALKLADYFGVSVPYLLGIEPENSNSKSPKNIQGFFKEMSELYQGDYLAVIEWLEKISNKIYFNSSNRDRLEEIKLEKEEIKKKLVQLEAEAERLRQETSDEIRQIINNIK